MVIMWGSYIALTREDSPEPKAFDIAASYRSQGSEAMITDTFHIDLIDYWNTRVERSEIETHGETLGKILEKIAGELTKVATRTERVARIAEPTGLNLSVTALRNLRALMSGSEAVPAEKLDPGHYEEDVFVEVLGVSWEMAIALYQFFNGRGPSRLEEIEGMTAELAERARRDFKIDQTVDDEPTRQATQ